MEGILRRTLKGVYSKVRQLRGQSKQSPLVHSWFSFMPFRTKEFISSGIGICTPPPWYYQRKNHQWRLLSRCLVNFLQRVLSSNLGWGGFFFNREKQLFAMNHGEDWNYHAETHLSIIWVIKVPMENIMVYLIHTSRLHFKYIHSVHLFYTLQSCSRPPCQS